MRALAVLPVVAFHVRFPWMRGGFVGVDVFFVISGFLITGLILEEQAKGRFSLLRFYQRRVLRIFPALILVILATGVAGWIYLAPEDFRRWGASVTALSVFQSNLFFWRLGRYFGVIAQPKPLLHSWSLSVEEQFYLLYPLYLIVLATARRGVRIGVTLLLVLASLAMSAVGVNVALTAAFYFLPTRVWELMAGALLAMGAVPAPRLPWQRLLARGLGIAVILWVAVAWREGLPFPGLRAVPPVLGAALVIWAGMGAPVKAGASGLGLANRWVVLLGRISYPLYLWHYPLLAFVFYLGMERPSLFARSLAIGAALVLAYGTFRLVEQPLRVLGRLLPPARVVLLGAASMAVLGLLGLALFEAGGVEGRLSPERIAIARGMSDRAADTRRCISTDLDLFQDLPALAAGRFCLLSPGPAGAPAPDTLVWGDSFAEALAPGFAGAAARAGKGVLLASSEGCPPMPRAPLPEGLRGWLWNERCQRYSNAILDGLAARRDIGTVVLAQRWTGGNRLRATEILVPALQAQGKRVFVLGPIPWLPFDVPRALYVRSLGFGDDGDLRPEAARFQAGFAWATAGLDRLAAAGARVIDVAPRLCGPDPGGPDRCALADSEGHPFYFDNAHLSVQGATRVSPAFDGVFD